MRIFKTYFPTSSLGYIVKNSFKYTNFVNKLTYLYLLYFRIPSLSISSPSKILYFHLTAKHDECRHHRIL